MDPERPDSKDLINRILKTIEEWRSECINVGDELAPDGDIFSDDAFVVTNTDGESIYGITKSGMMRVISRVYISLESYKKTGRHFDEVEEFLKKIKTSSEKGYRN